MSRALLVTMMAWVLTTDALAGPNQAPQRSLYSDVETHWALLELVKPNIIRGYPDGFHLQDPCLRREFVFALVWMCHQLEKTAGGRPPANNGICPVCKDGKRCGMGMDHCFCGYDYEAYGYLRNWGVCLLDSKGCGYDSRPCTRAYAASIVLQVFARSLDDTRQAHELAFPRFTDVPLPARNLVAPLVDRKIIRIPEDNLDAWLAAPLSRGEMVGWLYNIWKQYAPAPR